MAKKILFIEDEPSLQEVLTSALKKRGFEVEGALDGASGLALARSLKPDLVLLDLILPKMDGFEVLEKIKQDPAIKETPVIVLTNLENDQDVERVLALGAFNYLVKANYSLDNIIQKIEEAIH